MLRAYRKICTWIYRIMIAVCIVLVILMIVASGLQVFSRYDADVFWDALQKNGAQPLCSLTGDIHLHTLVCPDEARKARVLAALEEKGYLMGLEK